MKIVQDIIFALLVIGLNIIIFLLFNMNGKAPVSKRKLFPPLALILLVLIVLLAQNHDRYILNFNSALALFFLMVIRLALYKVSSMHPEQDARLKAIKSFYDAYAFPFFFIFFSIAQCVVLILVNLNE